MKKKFISLEELKNGKFHEKLDLSEAMKVTNEFMLEIQNSEDLTEEEKDEELHKIVIELTELRNELKRCVNEAKERIKMQNN